MWWMYSGDNICIECVCKKKVGYLINILSLYFLRWINVNKIFLVDDLWLEC